MAASKPTLVLPNLHAPSPAVEPELDAPRPASKRPPLTIASVSSTKQNVSLHHHIQKHSISSVASSVGSISISVSGTDDPAGSMASSNSLSPSGLGPSLYPTTRTSFDPDSEDGGRLNDARKIILDIQTAMNGPPNLSHSPGLDQSTCSRPRSSSSTSLRPIAICRPRSAESSQNLPRSSELTSLSVPTIDQEPTSSSALSSSSAVDPLNPSSHSTRHQSTSSTSSSSSSSSRPRLTSQSHEQSSSDSIEIEIEPRDLEVLNPLGEGAGGEVKRVFHRPSGLYMAKKTIPTSPNPSLHRQILRELAFNREVADGESPWIVKYYGAFLEENDTQIAILMEYCEGGSLDAIYKRIKSRKGRIGEKVLGRVAYSVLEGLAYLHTCKIIHRDVKPSNIVVTRDGQIKLCDLGVSGELIGSLAGTFMGTSAYMAPERIRGEKYSITSDVWSLGLTLLELALNRFPLAQQNEDGSVAASLHPFELLQTVVTFEMPSLDEEISIGIKWTPGLKNFLSTCLDKNPSQRPGPKVLLEQHPWIAKTKTWKPDLAKWLCDVWGWQQAPANNS